MMFRILPFILLFAAAYKALSELAKKYKPAENTVHMSIWVLWGGYACLLGCLLLVVVFFVLHRLTFLVLSPLLLIAGLWLIVTYFSLTITYDDEGFCVKRYWGKPRYYSYTEIQGINYTDGYGFRLLMREGSVNVSTMADGKQDFYNYAARRMSGSW